jgi:hypothetical protein
MTGRKRNALLSVLREARQRVDAAGDDAYDWSSWSGRTEALAELDGFIRSVEVGEVPRLDIAVVFAPTGPLQEVSMASGWSEEFLALAERVDKALGSS